MTPPPTSPPLPSRAERYEALRRALASEVLPAVVVLADALEHNTALALRALARSGKTIRPTTKSFRVPGLLRRVLERGRPGIAGLQCMTAREAAFLAGEGLDDLVVAYPSCDRRELDPMLRASREGKRIATVIDEPAHVDALAASARETGGTARALVDVDVSLRPAGEVHVGVRRSPIRTPEAALALAERARAAGVEVLGIMGYEAHVAGVPDRPASGPGAPAGREGVAVARASVAAVRAGALLLGKRLFNRVALSQASDLRARVGGLLRAKGFACPIVNGGGTGTLESAASDPVLTEISPGSLFLGAHIYDRFLEARPAPACLFALPISRRSDPGLATVTGGGWVASGAAGPEKLPLPWLPEGLALLPGEGAGEVQTPLRLPPGLVLEAGAPVFFRHAKAGEVMERVPEALLVEGDRVVERWRTYRGMGVAFV